MYVHIHLMTPPPCPLPAQNNMGDARDIAEATLHTNPANGPALFVNAAECESRQVTLSTHVCDICHTYTYIICMVQISFICMNYIYRVRVAAGDA